MRGKPRNYWSNQEFLELRRQYIERPTEALMVELIDRFFRPLIDGYWSKYYPTFPDLDEHAAKPGAVCMCWIKFDRFDPTKGSGLNYFTKIVQHEFMGEQAKAALYRRRFINSSSLNLPDR